jgi:hypothetical protein
MAIQLIINREWGLAKNENPNQGAFVIDELTELVEEAVLAEFEKIAERGGVLGAMETGYQRGKIQDESMHYEMLKHTGEYPIIGVNTFRNPQGEQVPDHIELARSTEEEKQSQLTRLADFHPATPTRRRCMLRRLQQAVIDNGNVFEVLMDAVRCCSLGQITNALFEVGGQYRRMCGACQVDGVGAEADRRPGLVGRHVGRVRTGEAVAQHGLRDAGTVDHGHGDLEPFLATGGERRVDGLEGTFRGQDADAVRGRCGLGRHGAHQQGQHAGDSDSMQSHEASVVVPAGPGKVYLHGVQRGSA